MRIAGATSIALFLFTGVLTAQRASQLNLPALIPQKSELSIPINPPPPAGQSNAPTECVVSFGPAIPIGALAFTPDGQSLLVGGYREVLVWDLAQAKFSKRLGGGQLDGRIRALALPRTGRSMAVADGIPGQSGTARLLDLDTGQVSSSFPELKDEIYSLAFSVDGKFLAGGSADKQVHIWSVADQKLVTTLKEHKAWVAGVAFSPNGKWLASCGTDKLVQIWEAGTWKPLVALSQADAVHSVAFSPDSASLAFTIGGANERNVRLWKTENVERARNADPERSGRDTSRQTRAIDPGASTPTSIIWDAKGEHLFFAGTDGTTRRFNVANNRVTAFNGHGDWVYCATLSADGTRLASGSADGTVRLWNSADGNLLATLVHLSPRTDEWLILTGQGYFAGSSLSAVRWNSPPGQSPETLHKHLHNAEQVHLAITGRKPGEPAPKPDAAAAAKK